MHSISAWSMICKNTCVRVPSESEELVFKYREFDLEGDLVVFIGLIFRNTSEA